MRANIEGTRNIMTAARDAGVEKIVYTSSVATLRAGHDVIDETAALADGEGIGVYKNSKVAAERLVEAMVAQGLPAVIVMPSTPIGPRDIKPTPTGRILVEAATGRIPAFVDTGLNLVHVDDVAAGHLLALEKGGSASGISWAARMWVCAGCWRTSRASQDERRRPSTCPAPRFIPWRSRPRRWPGSPARNPL